MDFQQCASSLLALRDNSANRSAFILSPIVCADPVGFVRADRAGADKDLLGFSDLVINRGLGPAAVGWIAFYELIPLLSRTLPFAVLVGTLVGLGRLRSDRELLAIEAAGLARRHLVLPILGFATAMTLLGLGFSLLTAPARPPLTGRRVTQHDPAKPRRGTPSRQRA